MHACRKKGFHLNGSEPRFWQRTSTSGKGVECAYCPHYGTRLYHAPERNPAIVNVKPGTLDNTKWVSPLAHLWLGSAQPWVSLPTDTIRYPGQPDSFEPLFQAWNDRYELGRT
ncbi:MAG: GFA family protein [Cyanobacteria bacterium J06638_28]